MAVKFQNDTVTKHKVLSDAIKGSLSAEGTTIKETESHGAYFGNLPEGIAKETAENLAKYNNDFVAASHIAIGEMAGDIFQSNKDAQKVEAAIGFFGKRDKVTATVHRTKTFRNNFAENEADKELTKHLVIQSTVQTSGFGLKSVRESMSEEFKDKYSK